MKSKVINKSIAVSAKFNRTGSATDSKYGTSGIGGGSGTSNETYSTNTYNWNYTIYSN